MKNIIVGGLGSLEIREEVVVLQQGSYDNVFTLVPYLGKF